MHASQQTVLICATRSRFIMNVYVSMLRGVNVGGNKVRIAELRDMYMKIGARNAETYIQSGNVVFDTDQN